MSAAPRHPSHPPQPAPVPYSRGLPRPTDGPLFAALGVTLLFAGLVTNWAVTGVGAIMSLIAAVVWFRQVFPEERLEEIPEAVLEGAGAPEGGAAAPARGAGAARPADAARAAAVRTEHPGHGRKRLVVPVEIHPYRGGIWGGLAGGVAMAAVACAWGVLRQQSLWLPINLLAGTVVPGVESAPREQLVGFHAPWVLTAVGIHLVGSAFVGLLFAVALPIMPRRPILFAGILAPLAWSAAVWASLGIVNPALSGAISWPWFVASQIAFGVVAGFVVSRFNRVPTMQFMPLSERLGVEHSRSGGSDA